MNQSQIALENTVGIVVSVERSIHHPQPFSAGTLCHSSIIFAFSERFTFYSSKIKPPKPNFTKLSALVSCRRSSIKT